VFEMTVFRRIRGVTGRDRHRNVDIRKELGVSRDVVNEVRHRRLSYFGHVVRMLLSRVPSISLYGRVEGTKPCGRPRKKWLDGLRENIKITRITLREYNHDEGPTIVELHCLSAAGRRWPVRCFVVTDVFGQSKLFIITPVIILFSIFSFYFKS